MHLAADTVSSVTPQFMDLRFSTVDILDKGAGLWNPPTSAERPTYVTHLRVPDHISGESTAVGEAVIPKYEYDYNYKTEFII